MTNNILHTYSSGGLGDALLVLSKLIRLNKESGQKIHWSHLEKHKCHTRPVNDLMSSAAFLVKGSEFMYSENPQKEAMELAATAEGVYIHTRAIDRKYAMELFIAPLQCKNNIKELPAKFICVQSAAGRMHDTTKRVITQKAINQLKTAVPGFAIVLLGPEYVPMDDTTLEDGLNFSGRTQSILDALCIINHSKGFVGHDGVMSYYAMMQKKATMVFWHAANLPEHYMRKDWSKHTVEVFTDNIVSGIKEPPLQAFTKLCCI